MVTKKKTYNPAEIFGGEKIFDYFKVKNKYYESDSKDGQIVLVEVSKKIVDGQIKMAKELAKNLKGSLDAEKVLTEVFMTRYDKKHLDELYKTVFKSKKKYKPKTRSEHCVDMKVGNHIIPLID